MYNDHRCADCHYYNRTWYSLLEPCNQCSVHMDDDRGGAYGDWFIPVEELTDRERRYRRSLSLLVSDAMLLALVPGNDADVFFKRFEELVRKCDESAPTVDGFPYELRWTPATDDGDGDDGMFIAHIPALAWKGCKAEGKSAHEAFDQLCLEYEGFDGYEWEYELRVDVGWVPSETIDGYKFVVERVSEEDGGWFTAYVPALGGGEKACCSDGCTVLGAIGALHDSIEWILEGYVENGVEPPPKEE